MIFCNFVCVSAASEITIKLESKSIKCGEEFDVNIELQNNPGISSFNLSANFDKTVLTPVSFTNSASQIFTVTTNLNAPGIDLISLDKVTFLYETLSMSDETTNGVVGKIKFKANKTINVNSSVIKLVDTDGTASVFGALGDVPFKLIDGTLSIKDVETTETTTETTTKKPTTTETTTKKPTTTETTTKKPTTTETTTKKPTTTETTTKKPTTTETTTRKPTTTETTTKKPTTTETTTESTTENKTETTTKKTTHSGGGSSKRTSATTENTTKSIIKEDNTESTTEVATESITEEATKSSDVNSSNDFEVKIKIGSKSVVIGDKVYEIDVEPYIQTNSSSTLVPFRFVALAICGGDVDNSDISEIIEWSAENKTATINVDGNTVVFKADSNIMNINGENVVMDNNAKAEITNDRMFIPFRALGKALGVNVDWNADDKTVVYTR